MSIEIDPLDALMAKEADRQARESGDYQDDNDFDGDSGDTDDTDNDDDQSASDDDQSDTTDNQQNDDDTADKDQQQQNSQQKPTTEFDINAHFAAISEGMFKSEDEFKAALPKFKGFDNLSKELEELKSKQAENPFADELEQKRNELKKSGFSKEQLKAFEQVNDLGDLSKLSPVEAKVMKLMLVDGYPEATARRKVDREFPVDDTTLEDHEIEDIKADLTISAKADLKALEEYKVEVSTPNPGNKILVDEQTKLNLKAQLAPVIEDFKAKFTSVANLNLTGKPDKDAIDHSIEVDVNAREALASDIQAYFESGELPLTQETYNDALQYARLNYLAGNLDKIGQSIWARAEAHFTKKFTDKYSNSEGLQKGDRKPVNGFSNEDTRAFKRELGVDLNR